MKWTNNHKVKRKYTGGKVSHKEDIAFMFDELQVVRAINKDFNISKHNNKSGK